MIRCGDCPVCCVFCSIGISTLLQGDLFSLRSLLMRCAEVLLLQDLLLIHNTKQDDNALIPVICFSTSLCIFDQLSLCLFVRSSSITNWLLVRCVSGCLLIAFFYHSSGSHLGFSGQQAAKVAVGFHYYWAHCDRAASSRLSVNLKRMWRQHSGRGNGSVFVEWSQKSIPSGAIEVSAAVTD